VRTLAEAIMAKVEVGLSAQRIYQDLVEESGFTDSYQSVKRFVRKLQSIQPDRVWRAAVFALMSRRFLLA
jgi:hypothetical protein